MYPNVSNIILIQDVIEMKSMRYCTYFVPSSKSHVYFACMTRLLWTGHISGALQPNGVRIYLIGLHSLSDIFPVVPLSLKYI